MATVKQILAPIDFGPNTPRVLDFARTLADAFGASLHVLHIVCQPMADVQAREACHADATTRLECLVDATDRTLRRVTTACAFGTPAPVIVRYAEQHGIDLIVMGTHSHGPTFQMLTGSIAEAVIGMAPCAVMTVKAAVAAPYVETFDPAIAITCSK